MKIWTKIINIDISKYMEEKMITSSFVKGYAVIKSKWVDSDILDTYLPFIATIIFDENMENIDENIISQKIQEKYSTLQ